MEKPTAKVTVSAGGIVVNPQGEVLLVHQDLKTWGFPKGHVEPGEDPLTASLREIMEETSLSNFDFVKILGTYGRYKIGLKPGEEDKREWKVMIFFLFKTPQSHIPAQEDPRHKAQWVALHKVEALLTHPSDKAFYKKILPML